MPVQKFEQAGFPAGMVTQRSSSAAPGSLLDLQNGFVTKEGIIRSRGGASRINGVALSDGVARTDVTSLTYHNLSSYFGVGTVIKRGLTTNIVTGLFGWRTTFARMAPSAAANLKEFTYFANPTIGTHGAATGDGRKKDNGTTTYNWGMDGPTASAVAAITPTVASNQPATTAIDDFAAAYTAQDGFGTEAAATSAYATSARTFTVPATKIERFRRTGLALNLSTQGEEAFIRIMLRVNNRQNLDHVEVAFSLDAGVFTNDYYTTRIRALDFTADNTWQEFKIRKPDFKRVLTTSGSSLTWANVDGIQITVGANGRGQVLVSADDARVEADTHVDGTVSYRVTLWNDTLKLRSNARRLADVYTAASYTTAQVTAKRQRVTIARPSDFATWDSQVTHWELWRQDKEVSGEFFFVSRNTVATASYNDDFHANALGEALIEDNHIPPAAQWVLEHDERLFLFGMKQGTTGSGEEEAPYAVRWSRRGYPESFPLTQYRLAGDPADFITGGVIWAGGIHLFTKSKIRQLLGSGGTYSVRETEAPVGTPAGFSIAASPQGVFYYAPGGIYLYNGNSSQLVSDAIAPIFFGGTTTIDGFVVRPVDPAQVPADTIIGTVSSGFYIFVYTDTAGARTTLYYEIATGRWSRQNNTTAGSGWDITGLHWAKTDNLATDTPLRAGTADGWIGRLPLPTEQAPFLATDGGGAGIPFSVRFKALDAELKSTDLETDLKDISFDIDTGGQSLTVEASFDGASYTTIGTVSTASRDKVFLPVNSGIGTIAFRCAIRISGTLTTGAVTIWADGVQHVPEPRRMLKSSTDYDQQGWPGGKLLQELQIEANTFGNNVTVTVEADGVDLAQTFTLNTASRKPVVFSFTVPNPRATNIRLKYNGAAESKIYGYQFQFLKEPLLVTILETEVIDEGWPGEKILQALQIEANTFSGNVTVTVEIDGVNLAQVFTLNTNANKSQVFSFNAPHPRATHIRLKCVGAAGWLYYKHQFQYLKEPLSVTAIETIVSVDEWPGPKLYRTCEVEIDTRSVNVTASVLIDNVVTQTKTLNTSAHTTQTIEMTTLPEGRTSALRLVGTSTFLFYGWTWASKINLPSPVTSFDSAPIAPWGGGRGWLGPRSYIVVRNSAAVTLSILMDGVERASLQIPAQTQRSVVRVGIPIGVTGRLVQIRATSTAPFQVWPESYIEAHQLDADREAQQWRWLQAA